MPQPERDEPTEHEPDPLAAPALKSRQPELRAHAREHASTCAHEPHERKAPKQASPALVVERAAALFRALGDTARLSLLERLAGGEYCVTELAEATGEGLSTISQRLRTLRSERLLRRRRVGKHVYYTLADHHVADLIQSAIEHAAEPH
ncbi:MAG: Transcriptional regulator, ArsR family [Myxococcaceae bacterium]|nr:Transcriptional regulator, ArsR family [Myxococcaceae bacterium]